MKKICFKSLLLAGFMAVAGVFASAAVLDAKEFKAQQKAVASKLEVLRQRLDKLGGVDLSLAFVMSVKSKDALAVSSTVLAYQDYAQKRSLGILMGAAIQNASNPVAMQQVRDEEFKKLLASAPQEQYGVESTFKTLDELVNMEDVSLAQVIGADKRMNPQSRAQAQVKKAVKQAAKDAGKKK